MKFICRHCDELCDGDAYRVTSVENDTVLLDQIVCYDCSLLARGLNLSTQKIGLPPDSAAQGVVH